MQRVEEVRESVDVVHLQQKEQQRQALRQFTKLAWLSEPLKGMARVMERSDAVRAFGEFLSLEYMEGQLQLWLEAKALSSMDDAASRVKAAQQLYPHEPAPAYSELKRAYFGLCSFLNRASRLLAGCLPCGVLIWRLKSHPQLVWRLV